MDRKRNEEVRPKRKSPAAKKPVAKRKVKREESSEEESSESSEEEVKKKEESSSEEETPKSKRKAPPPQKKAKKAAESEEEENMIRAKKIVVDGQPLKDFIAAKVMEFHKKHPNNKSEEEETWYVKAQLKSEMGEDMPVYEVAKEKKITELYGLIHHLINETQVLHNQGDPQTTETPLFKVADVIVKGLETLAPKYIKSLVSRTQAEIINATLLKGTDGEDDDEESE